MSFFLLSNDNCQFICVVLVALTTQTRLPHRSERKMRPSVARLSVVLPFLPMALGSFNNLVDKSTAPKPAQQYQGPFFISPKHDGIRLISQPGLDRTFTCFSRFGKPVFGMHWIEQELATLRRLSMDPTLCVDGELYLHDRESTSATSNGFQLVNGLVNRVRGKKSALTTDAVLEHCPTLPKCVCSTWSTINLLRI